jgi:hypothetical protein
MARFLPRTLDSTCQTESLSLPKVENQRRSSQILGSRASLVFQPEHFAQCSSWNILPLCSDWNIRLDVPIGTLCAFARPQ